MRPTSTSSGGSSRSVRRANRSGRTSMTSPTRARHSSAQRDRSGPSGTERGADRPARRERPVDGLHPLDEELAALLALAPVAEERLEDLELGALALDPRHAGGKGDRPWLARSAASRNPSRKAGWAMAAERVAPLVHGLALELGGAVLGDDDVHLVPRGGDHGAGLEPGDDPRVQLSPSVMVDGMQSSERSSRSRAGPGHEVLVAADARVLHGVDRVGDHLALDVDRHGGVDRDHGAVARRWPRGSSRCRPAGRPRRGSRGASRRASRVPAAKVATETPS